MILFIMHYIKLNDTIRHESDKDFALLENNSIIKQSIALYKEQVKKVME